MAALVGCTGDDSPDDTVEAPEPDDDDPETDGPTEDLPDPTDTETALIDPETLHRRHEADAPTLEVGESRHSIKLITPSGRAEEWRVDNHDRTDGLLEASDLEITVEEIPALDSPEATQVETADRAYMTGQ